jgi:hypothetical protein
MRLHSLGGDHVLDPIASSEELDAELARIGRRGGTPEDFEVEVKALAARMEKPASCRAVLRIARVGCMSFNGLPDVPGDELPEFLGRRWVDLPSVPRRIDGGGPRQERLPDEPLHRYLGYLGEELFGHLGLGEADVPSPIGQAVAGYVSVLAIPDLRRLVGWERSLDAHALGMLTAERALRHLGETGMTDDEEERCFRWLHGLTYEEATREHLDEVRARREIRLAHRRRPAGHVAVMTCEVDLEDALWFHERVSAGPTASLSRDQLLSLLDTNATQAASSDRWAVRREGFGHIGRLDLTASGAAEGPDYGAFVHGHLMRWIVEEEVPFRSHLLGLTSSYASSIHRSLVQRPAENGEGVNALTAHARAIGALRKESFVPLADELVVMAWLMEQRGIGVHLGAFLDARDKNLAASRRT